MMEADKHFKFLINSSGLCTLEEATLAMYSGGSYSGVCTLEDAALAYVLWRTLL